MSWAIGYDEKWKRDIGYGVPAVCDHPDCNREIDRGLAYVCGGEPYGGELGCGLFFCGHHQYYGHGMAIPLCEECNEGREPFPMKPDTQEWIDHKLTDPSWQEWRDENPDWVKEHTPPTTRWGKIKQGVREWLETAVDNRARASDSIWSIWR